MAANVGDQRSTDWLVGLKGQAGGEGRREQDPGGPGWGRSGGGTFLGFCLSQCSPRFMKL